jgi:hypothetical protein
MARSSEGKSHGAELATGWISLQVRYGSAMAQIGKDFRALETDAKASGARAGESVRKGLADGASHGAKQGRVATMREWAGAEVEAKTIGDKIGKAIGYAISAPIALPIRALRGGMHKAGESLKEFGAEGQKAVTSIVPASGMAAAGMAAIAPEALLAGAAIGAVVGPLGLLLEQGAKWGKMKNSFIFSAGMDPASAKAMTGLVAQMGTEVPASFELLSEKALEAQKNLHLTGDAMKTVVEQAAMLQQKGGVELDFEGLGMMKRALGTKDGELPALLDQLYTSSQRSGVQINSMVATLSHAGPLLKQFGIDAGQSAGLLTKFDEAGVDINKVIPSMGFAFKASAKAGQDFGSYVKENVEKLQQLLKVGDKIGAENLAGTVFGKGIRGGGVSVLTALENGQDLSSFGSEGPTKSILGSAKATETMGDKWKEITNSVEALMKPYAETLIRNVAGWFGQFATYLKENGPKIMSAIAHALTNTRHAIDNFGHAMGNVRHAWDNFTHAMVNTGHAFGNIGHALGNVGHAFGNIWHACENVWHALENVWHAGENVWHACENVWHAGENVWHALENVWHAGENVWHALENVWHAVENVKHAFDVVGEFLLNLPGKIGEAIEHMGAFLVDKIGNLFSGIHIPGFAGGGAMSAPGPNGRDSALFWGANNEHVLTSQDVDAMGGHAGVYAFRNALHRNEGGEVGPDVDAARSMAGIKYSQSSRNDCSGMVARVISTALGMGGESLPTTKNMGQWLGHLGFRSGRGGDGSIRVGWYDHGPNANDGHAAMTLSDGENAEAGGKNGVFTIGSGAAGADNPEFDQHMYLPISAMYGEGSGGSGGGGAFGGGGGAFGGGGGMPAGATPGVGPNGERGYFQGGGDPEKVTAAKDQITSLQDELKSLENQRDHSKKALSDDDKHKLDDEIEKKHHDLDRAEERLQKAEQGTFHKSKEGKGEGGDKDDPMTSLGDIFSKGLTESFLPPGFINPLDTPLAKSGGAALSFFGSLLSGQGLGTSSKVLRGFMPSALTPHAATPGNEVTGEAGGSGGGLPKIQPPGAAQLANLAGFTGGAPGAGGGGVNIDQSINYHDSTIGHDPQEHQQAVRNDQNAQKRANVGTQRYGFV